MTIHDGEILWMKVGAAQGMRHGREPSQLMGKCWVWMGFSGRVVGAKGGPSVFASIPHWDLDKLKRIAQGVQILAYSDQGCVSREGFGLVNEMFSSGKSEASDAASASMGIR